MANLAASGVTTRDNWTGGGNNGKKYSYKDVTVVLTAMGTTTNKIGAAALGLSKIKGCSPFTASDDAVVITAAPNYAEDQILLQSGTANTPLDATGTFHATVWGNAI